MNTAEKLQEAQTAYHNLMVGQQARVYVDQNGERVEYTATTAARLLSYINQLKKQLGIRVEGGGPLNPYF